MKTIVTIHSIDEQVHTQSGEMRFYAEVLFSDPLSAGRINITKAGTATLNTFRQLIGKTVLIGLEQRKFNGMDFWSLTSNPVEIDTSKLTVVSQRPGMFDKPVSAVK